jgi:hypothetical protein
MSDKLERKTAKAMEGLTYSITDDFYKWKYMDHSGPVPDRINPPKIEGLLPCPFCSSTELRIEITRAGGHGGGPGGLRVGCKGCGGSVAVDEYNHKWEALPGLLKKKWNTRG